MSRILLCSRKIYYDLLDIRTRTNRDDVTSIRVEQLYPLRIADLEQSVLGYLEGTSACWVQEEPANMGAGSFLKAQFGDCLFGRYPLELAAPTASPSPSGGSTSREKIHPEWLESAFAQPK